MYICCDRNNKVIGKAKTEKEAQEICSTLGSSYMKILPLLFWLMRNYNRFYTYSTTKGFLKYKELVSKIKELAKNKFNKAKNLDFDSFVSIYEEFFGDCTCIILKNMQKLS